jgi:phage anti-repressor protein
MSILTHEFVFNAIEAEKIGVRFPVDFDDIWQPLGYSRRNNAGRRLIADLIEGHDYLLLKSEQPDNHKDLSPQQKGAIASEVKYKLTVEAFKMFAMAARTQQGREVRKYFIEIEQAYIQNLERQFQLPATEPLAPFPHTLTKLHQISGIVSRSQVRRAVTRDYHFGTEYIKIGRELFLTEDAFNWLVTHFESERGTDIEQLPETIPLKRKGFKRKASHKNARISSEWEQLNIPFPN